MSSPEKKRKPSSPIPTPDETIPKRRFIERSPPATQPPSSQPPASTGPISPADVEMSSPPITDTDTPPAAPAPAPTKASERAARFAALKARQQAARTSNLKEAAAEAARAATDPNALASLGRKHAIAAHKLLKAETADQGGDFERKRAWDWTVEEAERWDRRVEKKARHKADVAFQDYTQDARKVYKRKMKGLKPDVEGYEKRKMEAIQRAAASGGLEIVELSDGEMVAVDRDGSFYSTEGADAMGSKPEKEAVDRLVADIKKAEEVRLKKMRERRRDQDDNEDVTYINQKNKVFNEKLKRFYDKYTADIRDSFERGTAI